MIETKEITKKFDGFTAVNKLSCHIPDGSIYGMVGSNGAGKSTFLRMITGIYKPDEGEVLVDGENIFDNDKMKSRMIFVPDELYFLNGASLEKMADFYRDIYKTFDMDFFRELVKEFDLPMKKAIDRFSKGMKRQSSIILGLSIKPDYYIFDETFDGLDPIVRNHVKSIICKEVEASKSTAIITSHSLREMENLCDQLAFLHKGGLILENDVCNLKTSLFKVQLAFERGIEEVELKDCDILEKVKTGSVISIIARGDANAVEAQIKNMPTLFYDMLPLTLEEIFTYEMSALGYCFDEGKEGEAV